MSDALADLVRECAANGTPLVDYGVAHAGLGHPPPADHVKLTLDPPNETGILEHYERDMTIRVAAGAKLGNVRRALREANQFLPIDADDDLSLGEVIDHHVYGPTRLGFGSVRDLLLGLSYIDGEGRDIKVGGRTVKNVAGYDLTRFMVGGLGEFGVVHEATLRTYARPEQVTMVDIRLDDPARVDPLLSDWLLTDAAPTQLALSNEPEAWTVHAAYFGRSGACAVQLRSLETLLEQTPGFHIAGSNHESLERCEAELTARRAWRRRDEAVVKLIVPPASTGGVCNALAYWADEHANLSIHALPAHGCVFAGGHLDAGAARRLDEEIRQILAPLGGQYAWHARPEGAAGDADSVIEPFGPPQEEWSILANLKRTMDPHGVLNPGRFVQV